MAITTIDPVGVTVGTGLGDVYPAVAAGKVDVVDIRVCNVGSADSTVDLYFVNVGDATKNHYVWRNEPVPYNVEGSGFDLERGLEIPEGWKIQGRAGAVATVTVVVRNARRRPR